MSRLAVAKSLVSREWAIFPCVAGQKRPATWRGFLDATKDEVQINRWFYTGNSNIGVATGGASGVVVIDVDCYKEGGDRPLLALTDKLGSLPDTHTVRTRAGGLHLYFRMPAGADLRSYNNQIAAGIDLRANGGYVISEGSACDADKYGPAGEYVATERPIADLPEAWVAAWTALNARQDELQAKKKAAEERKAAKMAQAQLV